jgi:hypothetical protein
MSLYIAPGLIARTVLPGLGELPASAVSVIAAPQSSPQTGTAGVCAAAQ